ncbi:MAG: 5'/3'-nucleotidase SurE [Spirochaetes bacterium GWF1_41_5]|nr:MAG: 5'/3'-nucleotidase SurE [Spirochaetes bacterium GWF1_41_5]
MNILLINDDGYQAAGINALYRKLTETHKVIMIAPDRERSGCGMSFTIYSELLLKKIDNGRYSLSGTPVDCAKTGILKKNIPVDLVISGINMGPNLGNDINYSGTVSAAHHAWAAGVPALAISHNSFDHSGRTYDHEASAVEKIIGSIGDFSIPFLYNINFPADFSLIKGLKITVPGKRIYKDSLQCTDYKEDSEKIFFQSEPPENGLEPESDTLAVTENFISLSPLSQLYAGFPLWVGGSRPYNIVSDLLRLDKNLARLAGLF